MYRFVLITIYLNFYICLIRDDVILILVVHFFTLTRRTAQCLQNHAKNAHRFPLMFYDFLVIWNCLLLLFFFMLYVCCMVCCIVLSFFNFFFYSFLKLNNCFDLRVVLACCKNVLCKLHVLLDIVANVLSSC